MKLSNVALTISALITLVADAVHKNIVVPTLRKSAKLKAKGLDLAFQEHDRAYWDAVDEAVTARKFLNKAESNIKASDKAREQAHKAIRSFSKSQVA